MSKASASRTIKFISKAGTYTAMIMSPQGDLYQEYSGDTNTPSSISCFPNWEEAGATKPELYLVITSSRVSEGLVTPISVRYFMDTTEITFGSNGMSNGVFYDSTKGALFERILPSAGQPYYGLRILRNIAVDALFEPTTIKMVAGVEFGTQGDTIQATYNIPVHKSTGDGYRTTIMAGDSKNFVISDKDTAGNSDKCILRAKSWMGTEDKTTSTTFKWFYMDPANASSGWSPVMKSGSQATGDTLTVSRDMVDTYSEFRVEATFPDGTKKYDIQGVMDVSDPYDIIPGADPEDETIEEGNPSRDHVTYTPRVVTRGSNTTAFTTLFYFVVKDSAGVILNKFSGGALDLVNGSLPPASASFTVTSEMCEQSGGDVSVTITTQA